jgi:hypothetical protein
MSIRHHIGVSVTAADGYGQECMGLVDEFVYGLG